MKIGISINLFDGEELLKPLLVNIRPHVDYINVVYQEVSYWGEPCSEYLPKLLNDLKNDKLIDEVIKYDTNLNIHSHINETNKRNLGLFHAVENNCTHFMTMDTDEFYDSEQFCYAKNKIDDNKFEINSSACHINDYYKLPTYKIANLQSYFVPFIYKINNNVQFHNMYFPAHVDPTRRLRGDHYYQFKDNELVMQHMTSVRATRDNLFKKFNNNSSRSHFGSDRGGITDHIWNYNPQVAYPHDKHPKIVIVEDKFRIKEYFREFAMRYL